MRELSPAVVRLFISAGNNGPVTDTGARAHESYSSGSRFLSAERANRRSRQCRASLGPPQKTEKVSFETNAVVSRRPARGPAKPSSVRATSQSAAGTDVAVGVIEGELAVITSAGARKRHTNRQSSFGPTCRLVSSPEVGLGATVGTLEQGYPLLQYGDAVPAWLSLVAW
jgi:hypothetical protein